jgi:hypothetical protein
VRSPARTDPVSFSPARSRGPSCWLSGDGRRLFLESEGLTYCTITGLRNHATDIASIDPFIHTVLLGAVRLHRMRSRFDSAHGLRIGKSFGWYDMSQEVAASIRLTSVILG